MGVGVASGGGGGRCGNLSSGPFVPHALLPAFNEINSATSTCCKDALPKCIWCLAILNEPSETVS